MRSDAPTVSVLVPTYNGERFIGRALRSILAQTYPAREIVVIDDGSSDSTAAAVAAVKDARIRFLRSSTNLGMIRNWNRCLAEAAGDIIAFLHDDDYYEPRCLAAAVAAFQADPELGVWACSARHFTESGRRIGDSRRPITGRIAPLDYARQVFSMRNVSPPSETILRAAAIAAAGGSYDTRYSYAAEADLYLRIALAGFSAFHSEEILCNRTSWAKQSTARMMHSATNFRDRYAFIRHWEEREPALFGGEVSRMVRAELKKQAFWSVAVNFSWGNIEGALDVLAVNQTHERKRWAKTIRLDALIGVLPRLAVCLVARAFGTNYYRVTSAVRGAARWAIGDRRD